jgi:hypothetical protein
MLRAGQIRSDDDETSKAVPPLRSVTALQGALYPPAAARPAASPVAKQVPITRMDACAA